MKRKILVLIMVAIAAVIVAKLTNKKERTPPRPAPLTSSSAEDTHDRHILYLFYDQADQDVGARRIYAYVDRAERELAGKVAVRRVDVDREMNLVNQLRVRGLPTILIVSPSGGVEKRFEDDDKSTVARIEQALERLKGRPR